MTLFLMSDDIFKGLDQLAGIFAVEGVNLVGVVIFVHKILEMAVVPSGLFLEMLDIHFLSEGDAGGMVPVVFAPGKMAHELSEAGFVKILGCGHPANVVQNFPVGIISKANLVFYDMDDGKFISIQH